MRTILALAAVSIIAVTLAFSAGAADAHYTSGCKAAKCKRHVIEPHRDHLRSIRQCETHGLRGPARWRYNGSSGFDGAYQFSPRTWRATGTRFAYAYQAHRLEQSYRAVVWAARIGWAWRTTAGWPNCG